MKKFFVFMLVVMMMFISIGVGSIAAPKYYTIAAPPASSSLYPYWVAVGKAIQTVYPDDFQITVTESQGAVDIASKVRIGVADFGNSMSNLDYEMYNGVGTYKDDQVLDLRIMWYWDVTPIQIVVREDSKIKNIQELAGKKFNPGTTGGGTAKAVMQVLNVLGIDYNLFEATQADAADAVSNRQIVGTAKQGKAPDSYVMQIAATTSLDVLSFSDSELEKICEELPYFTPVTIPAGAYDWLDHEVKTFQVYAGAMTLSTRLTQEEGYKIFKAMNEGGKSVWQNAYPLGADNDLLELTPSLSIPLHAGTVQYLKEKGVDVPEYLIPPEYEG